MSREAGTKAGQEALGRILLAHLARYPLMQPVDLYKLLHQAAMGSEHAAPDEMTARPWLEREIRNLGEGPGDPLIDPIAPGGEIVRVHLRPYLAAGYEPERLLHALLRTGREHRGSTERLAEWGQVAAQMAEAGWLPFGPELRELLQERAAQGYGAAHHSRQYVESYRPAYRVVTAAFLPSTLQQRGGPADGRRSLTEPMDCRPGCGACCIAVSISSPIPGMLGGKPAGVRCVQLTANGLCALFGRPERPAICARFRADPELCGENSEEALARMSALERATRPGE